MTKEEFFKGIEKIKSDKLFITDSLDIIDEEIRNNCWSISISDEIAGECTVDELKGFLIDVKENRLRQLRKVNSKVRLTYYVWIDEQAGQLRFNFINSRHSKLPFKASLTFVDKEDEILTDYLNRQNTDLESIKVFQELIGDDNTNV